MKRRWHGSSSFLAEIFERDAQERPHTSSAQDAKRSRPDRKYAFALAVVMGFLSISLAVARAQSSRAERATPANARLAVTKLHNDYGMPDAGPGDDEGPKTVEVDGAAKFASQIGAYAVGEGIWIAPKHWTGQGGIAVDGNVDVSLYPRSGGSDSSGPRISYKHIYVSEVLGLYDAAPYFQNAMKEYNEKFLKVGGPITIPKGLKVSLINSQLAQYSLPDEGKLLVRGVAYYGGGDDMFQETRFILPQKDEALLAFLEHVFIAGVEKRAEAEKQGHLAGFLDVK